MNSSAPNNYFVVPPNSTAPIAWNPADPADRPLYDCLYFGGVLSAFEERWRGNGLTVYLTPDVERLPSYGPAVVAVVISDEWARFPDYAPRIRATFKCYGTDLIQGPGVFEHPSLLGLATTLQFVRMSARRLPSVVRHTRRRLRGAGAQTIFPIPLGYFRQADLPLQPIAERRHDAYFRGSMAQRASRASLRAQLLQTPKTRSRSEMTARLQRLGERFPEYTITVEGLPAFFTGSDDEALEFSEAMMQTKVCVVPRGASFETFRYFEALRYGCVVIAEALPRRWFYDGSPAITIARWSQLESVLLPLLRDRERLQCVSAASLAWWSNVCSEVAVGTYMADRLPGAPS